MEQTILFQDVRGYVVIWSLIFVVFLLVMLVYLVKLYKKHPELKFRRKEAEKDSQNQDLARKDHNMTMYAFCLMFVWAAGVMFIVCGGKLSNHNWIPLLLVLAASSLPLMGIKRRKK